MTPARRDGYAVVLTDHVFDKVRSIDMTLAEFEDCSAVERSWRRRRSRTASRSWS